MLIITVFYIWATIQSVFLGLNIFQFRRYKANWFLISFLLLTATNILFQYVLIFTDFKFHYPEYVFVSDAVGLLYGPVLYLYCRQLIFNKIEKMAIIHFIPAAIYILYFVIVEMIFNAPFEFYNYIGKPEHITTLILILISSLFYLSLCWSVVKRVKNGAKIVEFKFIFWLEALLIVICFKTLFNVFSTSLHMFIHTDTAALLTMVKNIIFIASNTAVLVGLQLMISKHPYVINKMFESYEEDDDGKTCNTKLVTDNKTSPLPAKKTNYKSDKKEGFSISKEDAQLYLDKLNVLMLNEKPYLDAGLTEKDLASSLDIQPYVLSKFLNQHLGKRFNEYINEKRVENAKMLLVNAEEKNHTMFVISIDSGFKSESAFYNNFKKFSGCTPKEYQQKLTPSD